MRNIRLTVSYDGSRFAGFQLQPGQPTIQLKLQEAIMAVTGVSVKITGSGRTDAGVHAMGQVVNFFTESSIPINRWCLALNAHLPEDIVVWQAAEAPLTFHARKSAKRKTYCYTINGNRFPDALKRHMEFHHPGALDVAAMRQGLAHVVGEHDFTSFCAVPPEEKLSRVRTIHAAELQATLVPGMSGAAGQGRIQITMTGNGFLRHMVRIIAGTLIVIGEGKASPNDMIKIMAAKDRRLAGPTAKPQGLMLWEVLYDL